MIDFITNKTHIIKKDTVRRNFIYNQYQIHEYCEILECMIEIKHPSAKRKILKMYGIQDLH